MKRDVETSREPYLTLLGVMCSSKCEALDEFPRISWVGEYEAIRESGEGVVSEF
jgi:hypothetical protein